MRKLYLTLSVILAATIASTLPGCISTANADCCSYEPGSLVHEISALEMAVGEVAQLHPGPGIEQGGQWFAQVGDIVTVSVYIPIVNVTFEEHFYHAPEWAPFMPDQLTYVEPSGKLWNLLITFGGTRSIIDLPADEKGQPDLTSEQYMLWFNSSINGGDIHIIGEEQPTPITWEDEYTIAPTGGHYLIPVLSDLEETGFIKLDYLVDVPAEQGKIKKKSGPLNDRQMPPTGCTPGDRHYIKGYTNKSVNRGPWLGAGEQTATIDASFGGQIKAIFNLDLKVGSSITLNVKHRDVNWREAQIRDLYECKKGKWVYVGSQYCTRTATGQEFIPAWWCVIEGFPPYGKPQPFTPWQCVKTTKGF